MFYIYKITNILNNKQYVGLTTRSIKSRWYQHCYNATHVEKPYVIDAAIRKYGKENFEVEQIDQTDDFDELNKKEIYYVSKFNTLVPNGYNVSIGGGQPSPQAQSPESNLKRQIAMIRNWENGFIGFTGGHHTDDAKQKISVNNPNINGKYKLTPAREKHLKDLQQLNTGRVQSDAERKNRSKSTLAAYASGRKKPNGKGVGGRGPMSDEEKIKNKERQQGAKWMHNDLIKANLLVYKNEIDTMLDNSWKFEANPLYDKISRRDAKKQNLI